MSIANEIERISQSKGSLKSALEMRGAAVDEGATIDSYPDILERCPHVVRGFFTPEEDTNCFSVTGLAFAPHSFVHDSLDLFQNGIANAVISTMAIKENAGFVMYYKENAADKAIRTISPTSSAVVWGESGVSLTLPESLGITFKAGYAYEYIISGGFVE